MKKSLRENFQKILRDFSKSEIDNFSDQITNKLVPKTHQFDSRFIFLSTDYEVQTHKFIQHLHKHNKTVLIPHIIWQEMYAVIYNPDSELEIWKFWIATVKNPIIHKWKIDAAIIPWLAFDKHWWRLGRGKGYFDKFLSKYPSTYKIWLCFQVQITNQLPLENHDIIMNEVITD